VTTSYSFDFVELHGMFFKDETKDKELRKLEEILGQKTSQGWKLHSITRVSAASASGGTFLFAYEQESPPTVHAD
jgi:hypothetical protein